MTDYLAADHGKLVPLDDAEYTAEDLEAIRTVGQIRILDQLIAEHVIATIPRFRGEPARIAVEKYFNLRAEPIAKLVDGMTTGLQTPR